MLSTYGSADRDGDGVGYRSGPGAEITMEYLGFEEKTLMNAIIHNGFHPEIRRISLVCEKCKNPYVLLMASHDLPKREEWERVSVNIFICPECGNREMNIVGTYLFSEVMPGEILADIGSFMNVFDAFVMKMEIIFPEAREKE